MRTGPVTGVEFDCCGIEEEEEKQDEDGRDLKGAVVVKTPAQSGVPNRAEQLPGHDRAWNCTGLAQG